jgi:hypothetical protein
MTDQRNLLGFTPDQWQGIPQHLQSHLLEVHASEARAAHDSQRSKIASCETQIWNSASSVLNTLLSVNAGALVAILAFLGSMLESNKPLWLWHLGAALSCFVGGTGLAILAAFSAFFTSNAQKEGLEDQKLVFEEPFIKGTPFATSRFNRANAVRRCGIIFAIGSAIAAAAGSGLFLEFALAALRTV